jgi:hypothetical protein
VASAARASGPGRRAACSRRRVFPLPPRPRRRRPGVCTRCSTCPPLASRSWRFKSASSLVSASPPASPAFSFPAPSPSPARPTSPASTHDHDRAMRAARSSVRLHHDLLLSASSAPSPSPSPVSFPAVPPWPCGHVRLARLVPYGGRLTRPRRSSVQARSQCRPAQTCAKPRRRSRSRPFARHSHGHFFVF